MNDTFPYSLTETADWIYKTVAGILAVIFGYFAPVKDLVHMLILFFVLDMFFGYLAAHKLKAEKFSTKIVWNTTFPRILISIVLVIMAYMWDTTCKQEYLPTYNLIGWFISGVLIFSSVFTKDQFQKCLLFALRMWYRNELILIPFTV